MKLFIKTSVFLILLVSNLQAQTGITAIPPGFFTVAGQTFKATVSPFLYPDGRRLQPNTMYVDLVGGEMTDQATINITVAAGQAMSDECYHSVLSRPYTFEYCKADYVRYFDIMRSVFSPERVIEIMDYDNKGIRGIRFCVDAYGNIKDVAFSITENTLITPQEIAMLYTEMLSQMKYTLTPIGCSTAVRFTFDAAPDNMRDIYTDVKYFGMGPKWDDR